jgi:hypothetical protein
VSVHTATSTSSNQGNKLDARTFGTHAGNARVHLSASTVTAR